MPALTLPRIDPACYDAALKLVACIDHHLTKKTRHYRDRAGRPLRTLNEVINAILDGTLDISTLQPEAVT